MREIGKLVGITHQSVSERLRSINYTPPARKAFANAKAEILEVIQMQIADSLQVASWKKVSPAQQVTALAILEDKIRLIRGQSTNNVAVLSKIITAVHSRVPSDKQAIDKQQQEPTTPEKLT